MSGHAKELRRIADDLDRDALARRQHERTPKAWDLKGRALQLAGMLDDEQRKRELHGLVVSLDAIIRTGHDIDNTDRWGPFEAECQEMLARVEAGIQ